MIFQVVIFSCKKFSCCATVLYQYFFGVSGKPRQFLVAGIVKDNNKHKKLILKFYLHRKIQQYYLYKISYVIN